MTDKKTIRALEEAYRAVFQHLLIHKRKPHFSGKIITARDAGYNCGEVNEFWCKVSSYIS